MKITTDISSLNRSEVVDPFEELLANSLINRVDINFVADFKFNKMGSFPIYVGPYPQNEQDIKTLAENGITAVLNVQTDRDIKHRQVDYIHLQTCYRENNIQLER